MAAMMVVYDRWEEGWKETRPCLLGKVERSEDPSLQHDLAELMEGEFETCPLWFRDDKPMPQLKGWQSREDLRKHENVINVWGQLADVEISQEILDTAVELTNVVKPLQLCLERGGCATRKHLVLAVVKVRAQLRALLKLPPDLAPAIDTPITDKTPAPPPPRQPSDRLFDVAGMTEERITDAWSLVRDKETFTLKSKTGAAMVLDNAGRDKLGARQHTLDSFLVRDEAAPMVYFKNLQKADGQYVRAYSLVDGTWVKNDLGPYSHADHARRRIDVLYEKDGRLVWGWLEPGARTPRSIHWRYRSQLGNYQWACTSDEALWIAFNEDDDKDDRIERLVPEDALSYRPETKRPGEVWAYDPNLTCDSKAVWIGGCSDKTAACAIALRATAGELYVCDEGPACRPIDAPIRGARGLVVRNTAVGAKASKLEDTDARQQLVLVRARARNGKLEEKVLRLPSGARLGDYFVRGDKVIGTVTGSQPGEIELY
jgi:hypothetical protein